MPQTSKNITKQTVSITLGPKGSHNGEMIAIDGSSFPNHTNNITTDDYDEQSIDKRAIPPNKASAPSQPSKRSTFQFTYDSDNCLLDLIFKYKDDLFTRGNTLKTWEVVLNQFNQQFDSNIVQSRTINNRFKVLRKNLEKKLINEQSPIMELSLNENEDLLVNLNEYLRAKKDSTLPSAKSETLNNSGSTTLETEPLASVPSSSGSAHLSTPQLPLVQPHKHPHPLSPMDVHRSRKTSSNTTYSDKEMNYSDGNIDPLSKNYQKSGLSNPPTPTSKTVPGFFAEGQLVDVHHIDDSVQNVQTIQHMQQYASGMYHVVQPPKSFGGSITNTPISMHNRGFMPIPPQHVFTPGSAKPIYELPQYGNPVDREENNIETEMDHNVSYKKRKSESSGRNTTELLEQILESQNKCNAHLEKLEKEFHEFKSDLDIKLRGISNEINQRSSHFGLKLDAFYHSIKAPNRTRTHSDARRQHRESSDIGHNNLVRVSPSRFGHGQRSHQVEHLDQTDPD